MRRKNSRAIIQNHRAIANGIYRMTLTLRRNTKMTDDDKRRLFDLEEQAAEHERKAMLFGSSFVMIL